MTTATQQTTSNPALHFANMVRERTNDALDLIDILHDIAQGKDKRATPNDRITAANILLDRGLGKCPKQIDPNPAPTPKSDANDANDVGAIRESPSVPAANPRPVTQIKHALNETLGPAPKADSPLKTNNSLLKTIQQHILTITNDGQTLCDTLEEIARAKDDQSVTPYHRARAARILLDRLLGTALETRTAEKKPYVRPVRQIDPDDLAEIDAKLQQMEDEGILTPDYDNPGPPINVPEIPEGFDPTPYLDEASEKFEADIKMQLERQKAWPAIEERRRKKLAQIYPSHSEDDKPPEP